MYKHGGDRLAQLVRAGWIPPHMGHASCALHYGTVREPNSLLHLYNKRKEEKQEVKKVSDQSKKPHSSQNT